VTDIPTITQEEAVEVRARKLLAAEVERISDELGYDCDAGFEMHNRALLVRAGMHDKAALRAIVAALSPNMDHAVGGVREALEQIAKAHDEWSPDANFASTVLARCSRIAREALAALSECHP
jgi:hypothetical protein